MEFAIESKKPGYVTAAREKLDFCEAAVAEWKTENRPDQARLAELDQVRAAAYKQTDDNLRSGDDPLAYLEAGG